jgi:hypothetical protein
MKNPRKWKPEQVVRLIAAAANAVAAVLNALRQLR